MGEYFDNVKSSLNNLSILCIKLIDGCLKAPSNEYRNKNTGSAVHRRESGW